MNKLDALLINPPSRISVYGPLSKFSAIETPVWAGLIARFLLNRGYSASILDAEADELTPEQTARRIVESSPRLAAFCIYGHQPSASTQTLPSAVATLKALKKMDSSIPTIALGTHPSALPEQTLKEGFDFVCQGEGPYTIEPLLVGLCAGLDFSRVPPPLHLCPPGLWWKAPSNYQGTLGVPSAQNISNLDTELPNQAWELLDMSRYKPLFWLNFTAKEPGKGGYASVQTSLGCVFRCSFCCIQTPFGDANPRMRFWSPANVAVQIANLVHQHGITNIKIADEMFCLNRQHVWQICNMLIDMKLGDRLNMWAYARVDTVKDEAMLAQMRKAGFRWLGIGIESASLKIRNDVDKGKFRDEDIRAAIKRVESHGLEVGANYIFGLLGDTKETMQETLDLAIELNTSHANFYSNMAYPGSPQHKTAKERGWRLPEDNVRHKDGQRIASGPGWIGYSQHSYESLPLPTETLTYQEVLDFRDMAWEAYHTRPEFLSMLESKFGPHARQIQESINALGMPKRKHREET